MLARITKGQDFAGCLRYVLERFGAERIGGNMEGMTVAELATEFDLSVQCQQRRSPHKPTQAIVCHTSLSVEVGCKLDDSTWNAIAKDYLREMGFDQNQYVLARHTDTQHDHVHLVVSRLRLDGTTVESWLDYRRAQEVLRQLEQQYNLQAILPSWETDVKPPTVGEIRQFRQTGEPSVRAMLQVAIDDALLSATTIDEFQHQLAAQGVEIRLRQISSGIAGISYKLNNVAFPGYKLGKRYTWTRIEAQLGVNYERPNSTTCQREIDANAVVAVEANRADELSQSPPVPTVITNADQQPRTATTVRASGETDPSVGRSGAEFDSRKQTSAPTGTISTTDSGTSRSVESTNCQFEPSIADDRFSNDADSVGTSDQHTRSEATPTAASGASRADQETDPSSGATIEPNSTNRQPTDPTRSDQTRVGESLRTADALRHFDGLHSRPDAPVSTAPTNSPQWDESSAISSEEAVTQSKHPLQQWEKYSRQVEEKNPVKRDEIVAKLALTDGRRQQLSNRENLEQAARVLWHSPYVQWMQEVQGIEKTRNYVKLTIQSAHQELHFQSAKLPRQRQRDRNHQHIR
jgi:hypothetical protein